MSIRDHIVSGARGAVAYAALRAKEYVGTSRVIRDIGQMRGWYTSPPDDKGQRIADSKEALFGRISTQFGPYPSFVSTNPFTNIKPGDIFDIDQQVRQTGLMFRRADLHENLIRHDAHLRAVDANFRDDLIGSAFTVEPVDSSELAQQVAQFQQRMLSECVDWRKSSRRLLFGRLDGYALEEAIYKDREFSFPVGGSYKTIECPILESLFPVQNRHTRFDISEADALKLDTGGTFIRPSQKKYMVFESDDDFQVRLRGYGYTASYLSMIKQNAWVRWEVLLKLWGIRGPMAFAHADIWQNEGLRTQIIQTLVNWGQGLGVTLPDTVEVKASEGVTDGDSRGMHAALIAAVNAELSKLIQGQQLTTDPGDHGSYGLSQTHQDTMASKVECQALNLSTCQRPFTQELLRLAIYEISSNGEYIPEGNDFRVNPRGLCSALKANPQQILTCGGIPKWRVHREMNPSQRIQIYDKAVNLLGANIAADSVYEEFNLRRPKEGQESLKGSKQDASTRPNRNDEPNDQEPSEKS